MQAYLIGHTLKPISLSICLESKEVGGCICPAIRVTDDELNPNFLPSGTAEETSKLESARLTRKSRIACQLNLMEQLTTNPKREGKFWEVRTFPNMFLGKGLWTGRTRMCVPTFNLPHADMYVSLVVIVRKRQGLQMPRRIPSTIVLGECKE